VPRSRSIVVVLAASRALNRKGELMMKLKHLVLPILAIAAIGFATPRPASAAAIVINDSSTSDTITFLLNDFEGGFVLDGTRVQIGLGAPASVTVNEANVDGTPITHTFSADWITGGLVPSTGVIAFPEARVSPALGVSDILTFTYSSGSLGGHLVGSFVSDTDPRLLPLPPGATVAPGETFVFNNGNITASAVSDVDPVPEPATLLLFGTGVVAVMRVARKRRSVL